MMLMMPMRTTANATPRYATLLLQIVLRFIPSLLFSSLHLSSLFFSL
jgi:hypothetical protein